MSSISIIACPKCGQKVGIPSERETVHVSCPKCGQSWDWPAKDSSRPGIARSGGSTPPVEPHGPGPEASHRSTAWRPYHRPPRKRPVVLGLVFLGVLMFAGYHLLTYTPPRPLPGREVVAPEPRRPVWNPPPEEPLPDNGDGVFQFDKPTAASKLRIVPRGEQGHVVVKVENATDSSFVCWVFIRQGQTVETPIPAGTYRLKLACGPKWYGEKHLFGPGASYSAIADEIKIPIHTDYQIDLHPSTAGTLKERKLRPEDF